MTRHPRIGSGAAHTPGAKAACALIVGLLPCVSHALVNVRAGVAFSPFLVSTNASDRANPLASYSFVEQTHVPNSLPPLFGLVSGVAEADGSKGTLRARAEVSNPGPGLGVIPGVELGMQASITESIQLFSTNTPGTRNAGTVGLGNPNDDFVTVRATGVLHGSGAVGSATGVPAGTSASKAGSARATFILGLGIDGGNRITLTQTESTGLGVVVRDRVEAPFNISLGNGYVEGDSVVMNLSKTFLANNSNTTIHFSADLVAFARGGQYSGSQVIADYGNTAYLDFDVEEGMFWQATGTTSTRNFLTNQVFAPSAVPEPGSGVLLLAGLALMGGAGYRIKRSAV